MFSGRVVLARMNLATGGVREEEVSTEDLWEIRLYKHAAPPANREDVYLRLIASDGGIAEVKTMPSPRVLAVYPRFSDTVALRALIGPE